MGVLTFTRKKRSMSAGIPEDVIEKLQKFDNTLKELEDLVEQVVEVGVEKHYERNAHDMALVDTLSMFLLDSLQWAVHGVRGEAANKNEELLIDLARTKRMLAEMKEINARQDAPRINQQAAANFVRNALWEVPTTDKTGEKSEKK